MDVEILPFDQRFSRTGFDCGRPALNRWLVDYAGQSERRDTTRTFAAVSSDEILGYYATRTYEIDLDEAAVAFGVGKRKYPVPAVLLARLAVDRRVQGMGLGKLLLIDVLRRLASVSQSVGFEVVVVDAIDEQAATFYRRWGFMPFADDRLHLFLTTKDLRATFDSLD